MEPLSSEARARLAAFRSAESPGRATADRCLAALEQRLDEGVSDDLDDEEPRRSRLAPRVLAGFALAAGVLLALTWAVTQGGPSSQTHVAAPYQVQGDESSHAAERRGDDAVEVAPRVVVPDAIAPAEPTPVPADTSDPADTAKKRPARAEDSVAAEVDLLRRAKLAEPAARIELLEEHGRRFPTGILAAERGLLEIEARCALGQRDVARELATSYPRRFPGSPLVDRAATLCSSPAAQP